MKSSSLSSTLFDRHRAIASAAIVLLIFALILAVKANKLNEQPIWDAAAGLFPAAYHLADSGFDILDLLQQPTFAAGGPNVHSVSPVTIGTAVLIRLVGEGPGLFPTLHLIHMLLAALAVFQVYRFSRPGLGPTTATLLAVAFFLFPATRVQAGQMYLEIPLVLTTVLAAQAWAQDRPRAAGFWAALATLVKQSGIVVAIALALAALLSRKPEQRASVIRYNLLPSALALLLGMLPAALGQNPGVAAPVGAPAAVAAPAASSGFVSFLIEGWQASWGWLIRVPDFLVLMTLALLIAGVSMHSLWRAVRTGSGSSQGQVEKAIDDRAAISALILILFLPFYALTPATFAVVAVPRYYIQVLPFVLFIIAAGLRKLAGLRTAALALLVLSAFFLINANGAFYPDNDLTTMPLIERSESYEDLHATQVAALAAAAEISQERPLFYRLLDHYRLTIPRLGYVPEAVDNGTLVRGSAPWDQLDNYPDRFALLPEWDGSQGVLLQLWETAESDANWNVEVIKFQKGSFTSRVILIDRVARNP